MPKWRAGSRGENEGSNRQLYKAQRVCYTGVCRNFDGENRGHTIVAYSAISLDDARSELERALSDHDMYIHGAY